MVDMPLLIYWFTSVSHPGFLSARTVYLAHSQLNFVLSILERYLQNLKRFSNIFSFPYETKSFKDLTNISYKDLQRFLTFKDLKDLLKIFNLYKKNRDRKHGESNL